MCVSVVPTCVSVSHRHVAWCMWRTGEGTGSPEPGTAYSYEPPRGCWELNLDPLEERPSFPASDPALQLFLSPCCGSDWLGLGAQAVLTSTSCPLTSSVAHPAQQHNVFSVWETEIIVCVLAVNDALKIHKENSNQGFYGICKLEKKRRGPSCLFLFNNSKWFIGWSINHGTPQ